MAISPYFCRIKLVIAISSTSNLLYICSPLITATCFLKCTGAGGLLMFKAPSVAPGFVFVLLFDVVCVESE